MQRSKETFQPQSVWAATSVPYQSARVVSRRSVIAAMIPSHSEAFMQRVSDYQSTVHCTPGELWWSEAFLTAMTKLSMDTFSFCSMSCTLLRKGWR